MRALGIITATCLALTVVVANWVVQRFGVIDVSLGLLAEPLMAPAAVLVIGLAFTLRDITHELLGRWGVLAAILAGSVLSVIVAPAFAFASAGAFLFSELADLSVYEPLRERNWLGAVAVSNGVGLAVDSMLFLWWAFGSMEFLPGQIVGKAWMTLAAIVVLWTGRRALLARRASA